MNKINRTRNISNRLIKQKRIVNRISGENRGFATSKSYVEAVYKIYNQEINDIGRFVKFAETYSRTSK